MADLLQFPAPLLAMDEEQSPHDADTLRYNDAEARAAALDIRRSWIVEAPAGSGKTGLLIQRFLKLLAFGGVERPHEVLAITFTRKAAAELRARVLEQLAAAGQDHRLPPTAGEYQRITRDLAKSVLTRDNALGWHLLASPHELNIRTIDSFCGELAGNLPLLSAGTGRRKPVEDASALYNQAAERTLRQLGGADTVLDDALRCVLLHRDAQMGDCLRLIASMLKEREQWGELVPLDSHELSEDALNGVIKQRLERTLERVVCEGLGAATDALDPRLLGELSSFAARLSTEPGYKGSVSPLAHCNGRHDAPGTTAEYLQHWVALVGLVLTGDGNWRTRLQKNSLGFELPALEKPWLESLIAQLREADERRPGLREALCAIRNLPPVRYPADQWRVAKALFRVLRQALGELEVIFAEQGVCDFTAIALTARRLLRSEPELLGLQGTQLTHLLVDEMQDTSAGQYQLLELLTRTWDGGTQTMFLVGDPKQSIYAFRQARVERFLRTQAARCLGDVPLGALRLTANFRSQAALVQQFNETFELLLPRPGEARLDASGGEVPFVAATATRAPGHTPALRWHPRVLSQAVPRIDDEREEDDEVADATAGEEASAIRRTIENFTASWKARSTNAGVAAPPRVAVLARSRAHLAPVIEEFHRDRGSGPLPFRAVDIEVLNERPEVLDLLALSRALLHPGDRIAWLAVLHSPVCGLGLADLLALTGEGAIAEPEATVGHLVATRASHLSADGQQQLTRAWPVLATAQASLGRTAFSTLAERTWLSLGADLLLRPDQKINVRRFFELLRTLEDGLQPLASGVLQERLQKLYAEPLANPEAVELMTIHKAKGLEWDLVIVPALERSTGKNRHGLLKWVERDSEAGEDADVVLAPIQGKGEESSALSKWLGRLERQRETAETKRLFYVACTRAREELHLFAAVTLNKGELALPAYDSLLRASWAAAEPAISRQLPTMRGPAAKDAGMLSESAFPLHAPAAEPLALAASADLANEAQEEVVRPAISRHATLRRLPAGVDPLARFSPEQGPRLPYPPAAALRHAAPFARPEGSFAARAFGNAVHRFLDLITRKLAGGVPTEDLLAELPTWHGRLITTFRSEGLAPGLSAREAERSLRALEATLRDPVGQWLLAPHTDARSERALQLGDVQHAGGMVRSLRADRTFFAYDRPLAAEGRTTLWIVDYKTAEAGGRSPESFLEAEKSKYQPQLEAYAKASAAASEEVPSIKLALFYPLLTHLLYWPFQA